MPSREELRWEHFHADGALRGVRKEMERNRKSDRVRRRDWLPSDPEDPEAWDDLAVPPTERVMPKGEQERRRHNLRRAQAGGAGDQGGLQAPADVPPFIPPPAALPAPGGRPAAPRPDKPGLSPGLPTAAGEATARPSQLRNAAPAPPTPEQAGQGLVLEASAGLCRVEYGDEVLLCTLRGSLAAAHSEPEDIVAAGDRVRVTPDGQRRGVIEAVLPRRGVLSRPNVSNSHARQVIAANVDQLLVVASYREPQFWPELVDRYLITAALNGLAPLICINKIDLAVSLAAARSSLQPYLALGYRVIFSSAVTAQGLDELRGALRGHTTVLAGLSGVGKSSLLSAVQPGLHLRAGEVNERQHLGRHTTTQAVLLRLDVGGCVIDTPGIKEFGLAGLRREDLGAYYPEMASLAGACRFADCRHVDEPGCAVRLAVRQGRMAGVRYDSYRKIRDSLADQAEAKLR